MTVTLSHCGTCCRNTETMEDGRCFDCEQPKRTAATTYPRTPNEDSSQDQSPRWGRTRGDA
jgi:hypothetical protein